MSDNETESRSVRNRNENDRNQMSAAAIRLPNRLVLGVTAIRNWKLFKQRFTTYTLLIDFERLDVEKQKALFIHCLEDDALESYNTSQLSEDASVQDIISSF